LSDYIIQLVCRYYIVDIEEIKSKTRKREVCFPRQVAMYLIKANTNYSLAHIGKIFNGKDHATVLHASRTVRNLMDCDKKVNLDVKKINKLITIKSKGIKNNIDLSNDFYFIDFNNYLSIRMEDNKGIILSGFTPNEEYNIIEYFKNKLEIRYHENTGFYILEQKDKLNDSNI
jgi:hypothetical protein